MEILISFITGFVCAIITAYTLGKSSDEHPDTTEEKVVSVPRVHIEQIDSQYFAFDKQTNQFLAQHINLDDLILNLTKDGDILVTFENKELEDFFTANFGK